MNLNDMTDLMRRRKEEAAPVDPVELIFLSIAAELQIRETAILSLRALGEALYEPHRSNLDVDQTLIAFGVMPFVKVFMDGLQTRQWYPVSEDGELIYIRRDIGQDRDLRLKQHLDNVRGALGAYLYRYNESQAQSAHKDNVDEGKEG